MALQDYAVPSVIFNSNPLEQITSFEAATNSGQQRVDTISQGLAGFTPGPGDTTISLGYAIPYSGPEDDFQQITANGAYASIQYGIGSTSYVGTGKIMSCTEAISTGAAMEGSFEWVGELKPRE